MNKNSINKIMAFNLVVINISISAWQKVTIKKIKINDVLFDGVDVRFKLNLKSNYFTIVQKDESIIITTKGYGHGVGLSQYGAEAMSKLGFKYDEILKYYYQGVVLEKLQYIFFKLVQNLNRGEIMKRKIRKEVKYGLYVVGFIALFGLIYSIEKTLFPVTFNNKDNFEYVSKTIFDDVIPVVGDVDVIKRPYLDEDIKVLKGFYDYQDDSENQEKSLNALHNHQPRHSPYALIRLE